MLEKGIKWPFQTSFTFPESPPAMPKIVSSRAASRRLPFQSQKMQRAVRCDSGYEHDFYTGLDSIPSVMWFQEQAPKIRYECLGRTRNYHPDVLVALTNGHVFVAEVKTCGDFGLFETICKVGALAAKAHSKGQGVFLGNAASTVSDFMHTDVSRLVRAAVVTASKSASGMSGSEWRSIRKRYDVRRSDALVPLVFSERLVVTQRPYNVRRATAKEAARIDAFAQLFESVAPVLPLTRRTPEPPPQTERSSGQAGGRARSV